MTRDDFAGIDAETVSGARVYDYLLGGTDNYAIDRVAADQVEGMLPGMKAMARNSRRFLERVVRYLADERGIRQFIDNGSGLPTADNVHQIAQRLAPESRVIYVDSDPTVLRHQKVRALADNQNAAFVLSDARDVEQMTEVSLANTGGNFGRIRSRDEVRAFFDGLEPVDPGLTDIRQWRPDGSDEEQADRWFVFGGVARKPG